MELELWLELLSDLEKGKLENKTNFTSANFTMVSSRALPLASGTGFAFKLRLTTFVENAVIVGLFEGEPHALGNVAAGLEAVLEMINFEGIDENAFTLECPMTFTGRTAGIEIQWKKALEKKTNKGIWIEGPF